MTRAYDSYLKEGQLINWNKFQPNKIGRAYGSSITAQTRRIENILLLNCGTDPEGRKYIVKVDFCPLDRSKK